MRVTRWLGVAAAAVFGLGTFAAPAAADGPRYTFSAGIQSTTTGSASVAEPIAPGLAGSSPRYRTNFILTITNTGSKPLVLERYSIVNVSATEVLTFDDDLTHYNDPDTEGDDKLPSLTIAANTSESFAPLSDLNTASSSGKLQFRLKFKGHTEVVENGSFKVRRNDTPSGGYRFPAKADDLAPGEFWSVGNTHAKGSPHQGSFPQMYAYDVANSRFDKKLARWTELRPGTLRPYAPGAAHPPSFSDRVGVDPQDDVVKPIQLFGVTNADHLIFGRQIYAMADGTVTACGRDTKDVPLAFPSTGDGNFLVVRHGNGEQAAYFHLMHNSVPKSLCPQRTPVVNDTTGDLPGIPVQEGQYLGRVGRTGSSSRPHLHVEITRPIPFQGDTAIRALPLLFDNIDVHQTSGFDGVNDDPKSTKDDWVRIPSHQPASLGNHSVILPNPCGWSPPIDKNAASFHRLNITQDCFESQRDEMLDRKLQPFAADLSLVGSNEAGSKPRVNMVFARGAGEPHVELYKGVDALQKGFDQHAKNGDSVESLDASAGAYTTQYLLSYRHLKGGVAPTISLGSISEKALRDRIKKEATKNFHLDSVSVFGDDANKLTYAALFGRRTSAGTSFGKPVTRQDLAESVATAATTGYVPTSVDSVATRKPEEVRYVVTYEKLPPGTTVLKGPMKAPQFNAENIKQLKAGKTLRSVTSATIGEVPQFVGVWR
jgi:hypothetical protein